MSASDPEEEIREASQPGTTDPAAVKPEAQLPPELRRQLIEEIEKGNYGLTEDGRIARSDSPFGMEGLESSVISRGMELDDQGRLKINGMDMIGGNPDDPTRYIPGKETGRRMVPIFTEIQVRAFDLADPKDAGEYAKVLELISSSCGTWLPIDKEESPTITVNPKSKRGFHAIIVVKWAKVKKVVIVDRPEYEEIDRKQIDERFPHYEEVEVDDQTENPEPPATPETPGGDDPQMLDEDPEEGVTQQ